MHIDLIVFEQDVKSESNIFVLDFLLKFSFHANRTSYTSAIIIFRASYWLWLLCKVFDICEMHLLYRLLCKTTSSNLVVYFSY